jgi:hypothetical protein
MCDIHSAGLVIMNLTPNIVPNLGILDNTEMACI